MSRRPSWNQYHLTWISENRRESSFHAEVKAAAKAKKCETMSDTYGKQWAIREAIMACWLHPPVLPEGLLLSNCSLRHLWSGKILFQSSIVRKLKTQAQGSNCLVLMLALSLTIVLLWSGWLTSLDIRFFFYKMGIITLPAVRFKYKSDVKFLAQCLAHS